MDLSNKPGEPPLAVVLSIRGVRNELASHEHSVDNPVKPR
jgi:hypothetical protein